MIIDFIKALFYGIVEGITEWLPVSSTGHLILFDTFIKLNLSDDFKEMFDVVIQLGAILAVLLIYFDRLNPFSPKKSPRVKQLTWKFLFNIVIACIPAAILGLLLDDWLDAHFYNGLTVAITLIVYGVLFILIERARRPQGVKLPDWYSSEPVKLPSKFRFKHPEQIDAKTAFKIGMFQCLSLIPGTSRSGSTILGAMLLDVDRPAASEFSFFLAIPVMLGASLLKCVKFFIKLSVAPTGVEIMTLIVGTVVAFFVSLFAIGFLVGFVRKHSFESFGWYRIVLGIIVLIYYIVTKII